LSKIGASETSQNGGLMKGIRRSFERNNWRQNKNSVMYEN
jgi:hypothetical protein